MMTNKTPQEIEEEVLKDFEEWREKGNWTSDSKAIKKVIFLTFQKSQEMMREEIERLRFITYFGKIPSVAEQSLKLSILEDLKSKLAGVEE